MSEQTTTQAITFGVIDGAGRTIVAGLATRVEAQGYAKACGTLEPDNGPYLIGEFAD